MPEPTVNFEGVGNVYGVLPADPTLAVGPNHVVQWVNLAFEVFDREGNDLSGGPIRGNELWADLGGACAENYGGSPIVHYDSLADRWFFAQVAHQTDFHDDWHNCIAVSVGPDPLGPLYEYDFLYSTTHRNEYPKWGVWPDAYYGTFQDFTGFGPYNGMSVWAIDRAALLDGDPNPSVVEIPYGVVDPQINGLLPADLSGGSASPPAGAPNTLVAIGSPDLDGSPNAVVHLYQFHPDFATPANSTFTGPVDLGVDDFQWQVDVKQPDGRTLENLPYPMYRLDYRRFGDHESLVFNHTINNGSGIAALRWYEIRYLPATATHGATPGPVVAQQGTFSPDSTHRWFGSAAMDASGDIAIGYSVTDGSINPSIRYAGRLANDPPGEMPQGEGNLASGSFPYLTDAWGEYSTMVVDPTDQCTFWYTSMYTPEAAGGDWGTRIGSFRFPSCTIGPAGTLHGTVTDGANPLAGVEVTAGEKITSTDASGAYSFALPVGTYDMTASKYGYLTAAANGIDITEGGDVVADFVLEAAPTVTVNGVVRDGSGGGWPLYAKLVIRAAGAPTMTLFTDPATGAYAQTLVSGVEYRFQIDAVGRGYLEGGGVLPLGPSRTGPATNVDWNLSADLTSCLAPGYAYPAQTLFETFPDSVLPAGWSQTNYTGFGVWNFTDPNNRQNNTGGTGAFAIVDSAADNLVPDDVALNTPSLDLSDVSNAVIQWNNDYVDLHSVADVDISTDGGTSWTNVWERAGVDDRGPGVRSVDVSALAAGHADARARFHFTGFYAWWWAVDNVLFGDPAGQCASRPGGLVVGNVFDGDDGSSINGATIENETAGGRAKTFATPDDPNQPDGMFILFSPGGSNQLKASFSLYASDQHAVEVVPGSAIRSDFTLVSGKLSASPSSLDVRVNPGESPDLILTLSNAGRADAAFEFIEVDVPALPSKTRGFAPEALRRQARARFANASPASRPDLARNAKGLAPLPNAPAPGGPMAAGDVVASHPSYLAAGWGVASSGASFWLSNIGVGGGDNLDVEYLSADGSRTEHDIDDSGWIGDWAADGAFNSRTGMMWRVNVGGDNCLHELDPAAHAATGNTICGSPWSGISQRGLAYDSASDGYFVGGWNEGVVYHIDATGTVIDSAAVGLPISGLAYNASDGHLLVLSNTDGADITVLDALDNYAVLGSFDVTENGDRVFGAFEQAGMEFDCVGNLWVMNQVSQTVYGIVSAEAAGCSNDIPWLSVHPSSGTVPGASSGTRGASGSLPVTISFDAHSLLPGLRQGQLQVTTDTPTPLPPIPVSLTVRFLDVPEDNLFQSYIYGAAGAGLMKGGPPSCPAGVLNFCPAGVVTRADMAGDIFRAVHGANTPPPVYRNTFGDVTFNQYNAFYIQGIYDDGITAGCGNGNYCPDSPVTRAQMSVLVWKGRYGNSAPPACTGVFNDVPCPGGFAVDYIEGLYQAGVTAGCGGESFCPNAGITNGQMAVFLVKAFDIPHLP